MPVQVRDDDPDRPWDEAGTYRVAPGVHRIPLPMPNDGLRAVNGYVVERADAVTLIDPGVDVATSREALHGGLAVLGLGLPDVDDVLVTHIHYDHYSQAIALRRDHGTPVWLGREERPSLERLADEAHHFEIQHALLVRFGADDLAADLAAHKGDADRAALLRELPDHWLDDGAVPLTGLGLSALHTPGHTRGHVVFHDLDASLLFAGDHVLPTITPSIGFEPAPTSLPLADYLRSLQLVRSRPDARLLPAHGAVTASVHDRVDELVDHHERRLRAIAAVVAIGAASAAEVAGQLTWTRRGRRFDELDPFNATLAVLETGYHLDLLVERGELVAQHDGGVDRFAAA